MHKTLHKEVKYGIVSYIMSQNLCVMALHGLHLAISVKITEPL